MILVCAGTRPELLKLAPVVRLAKSRGLNVHVHCTMQSPDLVDKAILPWDSQGSDPSWVMPSRPSLCVVQGDTRTAFETATRAYEEGIPVFHLEAGVRTYDLASPWPEEGYRQMISRIARYHACTTQQSLVNLATEGLVPGAYWEGTGIEGNPLATMAIPASGPFVRVTGSPIVESVRERAEVPSGPTSYVVLTLHRRENRGHFRDIVAGVLDAVGTMSVAWHSHPNSWASDEARDLLIPSPPLGAVAFAGKMARAKLVVTDSGGVQEEAQSLKIPAVICRTVTDRPENIGKGAFLAGVTREGVASAIREALAFDRTTMDADIFGDGKASERIVSWWAEIVGGANA